VETLDSATDAIQFTLGIFLHSSFSQILGNLIFLWVFGKSIEDILGHGRFLVFYLLSGILTGVVQILAEPTLTMPLIGANGAIAGVLGAYLLSFPKAKIDTILLLLYPIELPALFYLFWWFVQQMFYGIGSLNIAGGVNPASIAYWAHGVGLVMVQFGAIVPSRLTAYRTDNIRLQVQARLKLSRVAESLVIGKMHGRDRA